MLLYHYSSRQRKQKILKEGLRYDRKETYSDTDEINPYFEKYKPLFYPNRSESIFFWSDRKKIYEDEDEILVVIDSNNLDNTKLFVADHALAHLIWKDIVDAEYSGDYSGIPLEETVSKYWKTLTPFSLDIDFSNKEILYFGNIKRELINIIEF